MTSIKQVAVWALAAVAGAASAATSQPFTPTSATVIIDSATVANSLNGYTLAGTGGATLSGSNIAIGVQGVSLNTSPGPLVIDFTDAAGLRLTKAFNPTITLTNFSFDLANNTLSGDLLVGSALLPLLKLTNQSLLTSTNTLSSFGSVAGTNVASSTTARALGLSASNFELSSGFQSYLTAAELNPADYGYLASLIKEIKVGTVVATPAIPEPSTYALMGLGLVGIAAVSRRRQAANS